MHELSYAKTIVQQIIEYITKNPIREDELIDCVEVEAGKITGIVTDLLVNAYNEIIKETLLEESKIIIKIIPVKAKCNKCLNTYNPEKENGYACPFCGCKKGIIISGRGVYIKKIHIKRKSSI